MNDERMAFAERVSREIGSESTLEERARVFVDSPDWQTRLILARDNRIPTDVLERLANDGDPIVKAQALRTINGEPTTLKHEIGIEVYTARMAMGYSRSRLARELQAMINKSVRVSIIAEIEEARTAYTIDRLEDILNILGIRLITMVDYLDEMEDDNVQ